MTRAEAIAQGSNRYDTQSPCRYGHPERYVSNDQCVECSHRSDEQYKKPQARHRAALSVNVAVSIFLAPITRAQLMGRR